MHDEQALRAALASVPLIEKSGAFHRVVKLEYLLDQLRKNRRLDILEAIGSLRIGGRFNPKGHYEVLYLACDWLTAELEAGAILHPSDASRAGRQGSPIVRGGIEGHVTRVLDLTSTEVQEALGTHEAELTAPWQMIQALGREAPTQRLGRVAWQSGRIEGLLYLSAKNRPDGQCLAVFPDRLIVPSALVVSDDSGRLAPERLPRPAKVRRSKSRRPSDRRP